jgi:hypothetical protein
MEPTSDNPTSPKRRRFSSDNPFCDTSDTDASLDDPLTKTNSQLKLKPSHAENLVKESVLQVLDDPTINNQSVSNTSPGLRDHSLPSDHPPADDITFNGAFDDFNLDPREHNNLQTDWKRVLTRFHRCDPNVEGVEEINKTLKDLQPLKDVIYCYVRFARQTPQSNFNTDSLCSLLCVAKQCNMKPFIFLTKVKSLEIHKQRSRYGVSFSFVTRNTRDVDGVLLERKFLGLKYTLKLLQSTVSQSEHRVQQMATTSSQTETTFRPTKQPISLYSKLWLGITHRWLAYHIVDHLFSKNKASSWTNQQIFIFSTKILADCGRHRYNFLAPIVGICLHFNTQADIDNNQDELAPIRVNPSLFQSFGTTCLRNKPTSMLIQYVKDTFSSLKAIIQGKVRHRQKSYGSLSVEPKWLLIKAYTFHLWLEQSNNQSMKRDVLKAMSEDGTVPPSKTADHQSTPASMGPSRLAPVDASQRKSPPPPPNTTNITKPITHGKGGGIRGLLESRKKSWSQTKTPDQHSHMPGCDTHMPNQLSRAALTNTQLLDAVEVDWTSFRLLSTKEMDSFMASFLVIRREDGMDIVSKLSSFEIYSAKNLHKLPHCRLGGNAEFYPTSSVGQIVLNIGNKIDQFVDVSSCMYHIARESSLMFREHGALLPDLHDISNLCRAVMAHGKCDHKRCSSQRRAFIGNGGLDFPNGVPTTIVDGGFQKKVEEDPTFCKEKVLRTIGSLSEFLWKTMVQIQELAKDSPSGYIHK